MLLSFSAGLKGSWVGETRGKERGSSNSRRLCCIGLIQAYLYLAVIKRVGNVGDLKSEAGCWYACLGGLWLAQTVFRNLEALYLCRVSSLIYQE
jgi:hypothetical protein